MGARRAVVGAAEAAVLAFWCGPAARDVSAYAAPSAIGSRVDAAEDAQIATRIRGAYFIAPDIKTQAIDVASNEGVVTLTGSVPSEQVRERAAEIARGIAGVRRVDNQLTLDPPRTRAPRAGSNSGLTGSAWITARVQAQYFVNRDVGTSNVHVTTSERGAVTLTGDVKSAAERRKAVQIARAVRGVTAVNDLLQVTGEAAEPAASISTVTDMAGALQDAWITSQIESKLFIDPAVKGRTIEVDTKDGVVTMRGEVGSSSERRRALTAARQTDGVIEVSDELGLTNAGTERARTGGRLDDAWILTKLQSEFFADPHLRRQPIHIETHDGVVTLSGRVTEPGVKEAAEQIARDTDGVARVVNHLEGPTD